MYAVIVTTPDCNALDQGAWRALPHIPATLMRVGYSVQ
jgi:hypothetical protein